MIEHKEHFHGSDLEKIEQIFGIQKENIISFSANVNPLGISYKLKKELASHIDCITSYPDREYTSLRKAIAEYVNTDYKNIITGNGSTELIGLVTHLISPKKSLVIAPTYSEYEHELELTGSEIDYFELKEENGFELCVDELCNTLNSDIDFLTICNPNNPTSSQFSSSSLQIILNKCKSQNIFVMIDETYVEFSEDMENITAIPLTEKYDNLIVLRGISKFFAAPGLRLGYAICGNQKLLNDINSLKNPWTINSLAAVGGEIMFTDKEYIKATKDLIISEKKRICKTFDSMTSFKYYTPHCNFILIKILSDKFNSEDLFEAAIKKGLMIRNCSTFHFLNDKYVRFCFMNPDDNDKLLDVFSSFDKL